MFDADGDFIYEHDLESGNWDGHSYDCFFPETPCACQDWEAGTDDFSWIDEDGNFHDELEDEDEDYDDMDEEWLDYFTYVEGR